MRTYAITTTGRNREAVEGSQVFILAVEPQVIGRGADRYRPRCGTVSIDGVGGSGYPISRMTRHLPGTRRIVRAMPNMPSTIWEGATALAYTATLSEEDSTTARVLFEPIVRVVVVAERLMDVVTGLSGSGPASVFVMIEALADGRVKMGLSRETAQLPAAQTAPVLHG